MSARSDDKEDIEAIVENGRAIPGRKINLLLVSSGLGFGGAETIVRDLAQTIDRRRFNVSVCSIKELGPVGEELARSGVDITALADWYDSKVDYFTFRKLRRLIREKRIDIVHSHTTDGLIDSACLQTHHAGFESGPYVSLWQLPSRPAEDPMDGADLLTHAGSTGSGRRRSARTDQSVYHFSDRRMATVRNGVRQERNAGDAGFRSRIGAEDCLLVGTVATLIEQKGLRDLLAVARKVRDQGRRVRFVIVGDGHLRPELERLRSEYGLDDVVVLAGWVMDAATVAVPTFDVYFQPSLWEAMSIAILEAMAVGRPVVATRVGEAPHVIADGIDGLLVDASDIDGMAAAITRLADDAELRRKIGNAAARTVEQRFTMSHMAHAYEAMYLDTVKPQASE